jgi:tRNA G46 methylase TrmB
MHRGDRSLVCLFLIAEDVPSSCEPVNSGTHIEWLTIQFPDPWTKKKHHKRRLVDAQFVQDSAELLTGPQCKVYICSDRYDLACYMYDCFAASELWRVVQSVEDLHLGEGVSAAVELADRLPHPTMSTAVADVSTAAEVESVDDTEETWCRGVYREKDADDVRAWLAKRPFPVGTERDSVAERQNRPVHRAVFKRAFI